MTWPVYVALLQPLLLVPFGSRLARSAVPQTTARIFAGCVTITTASAAVALGLIVLTLLDDVPALERQQRSAALAGMVLPEPVPDAVAAAATLPAVWIAWRIIVEVRRRRNVVRQLRTAGVPNNGLLVADDDRPQAVAVPGSVGPAGRRSGFVLLTSGLLRLLDPDERAAVLAHERAHLRYRHHRLTTAAALAAAACPLFRPVVDAIGLLVERAADEEAAATVGDRRLVARAVARVALASLPGDAGVLGAGGSSLVRRVAALTAPPAPVSRGWTWLAGTVTLVAMAATMSAFGDFVRVSIAWWPPV